MEKKTQTFCYLFKNQTSACFCALHFLLIDMSMIFDLFLSKQKTKSVFFYV